jgi:hypothetical protein
MDEAGEYTLTGVQFLQVSQQYYYYYYYYYYWWCAVAYFVEALCYKLDLFFKFT